MTERFYNSLLIAGLALGVLITLYEILDWLF